MSIKKIPIAIGIKPNQVATFTNKTIDGTQNSLSNIPTSALQFNTITINGSTIPLGGSINIQAQGGSPIIDTNTTYSIKASSITGGASVDLDAGGSGVGTDAINFIGAGNVTVTRLDSNTIRISDAGSLGGVSITSSSTATLTNKTISGNDNTITNIPNSALTNNSITINGTAVPLGGSITVQGGSEGGGTGDVTLEGQQTLRNKTLSGVQNTFLSIPSSALQTPYISINGTQVQLGSNFNVSGLGDVTTTGVQDLSNKSLVSPNISNGKLIGTLTVGPGNGSVGTNGQVLKSTGTGIVWGNPDRTTATSLIIGSGLTSTGGSSFDGSNEINVSINTSVVATLTGTQTLSNKTLSDPTLSKSSYNATLPTLTANDKLVTEIASQTLSNKTIDGLNLTGGLTVAGAQAPGANYAIVSDGLGGIQWGQSSGGGGSGDVGGPNASTNNGIARFSGLTGKLIKDSSVTVADDGAIVCPSASSIIPFYFANQSAFPSATNYAGAVLHSNIDGAMYFAHGGAWKRLANSTEVTVSTRQSFNVTTGSLTNNSSAYPDITGAYKSYLLFKIQTDRAAWVRVYSSKAARSADTTRSIDTDPLPGSGVIAEVITTGASTQVLTPATIGFNDEAIPVGEIYLAVTNRSGSTSTVSVTVTALKLEA